MEELGWPKCVGKLGWFMWSILKRVKNQTGLGNNTYKAMYPMGCGAPKFYYLPKIHKVDQSPLVWLKNLVGKSPHHTNSTQDFVEQVKNVTLLPGECLSSYDVKALFTSVPVDPS